MHQPALHICVCLTVFRVLWSSPMPTNECMFLCPFARMHISARALSIGSWSFFMHWKLFLEWPSKSHGVQPCCLCAPACVIQFEWRKPRDTSVALSRLRSSTVCRWFFDGANLQALWMKGSDPVTGTEGVNTTNTWTSMSVYKHTHAKHGHSPSSRRIPLIVRRSTVLSLGAANGDVDII